MTAVQRRRLRLHLALIPVYAWLCFVWVSYAVDISPHGRLDRSGHIKGHDFSVFYVLGEIALDRATDDLYDLNAQMARSDRLAPPYHAYAPPLYGPQVSLFFAPFARMGYEPGLAAWLLLTVATYGFCCYRVWATVAGLRRERWVPFALIVGYPAFYKLVASGQNSALALACFTVAYLALRRDRPWVAGLAFGALFYKPSFGLVIPCVLLYSRQWKIVAGAAVSVLVQVGAAAVYYGPVAFLKYWQAVTHVGSVVDIFEPRPFQMQSLRSFFSFLLPWPHTALICYVVTGVVVLVATAICWRSAARLELRYSVLLIAAVLVDPHVNAYDLAAIAPMFILVAGWAIERSVSSPYLWTFLSMCYCLPALGFLPQITHVQVSVLAFALLLAWLIRAARRSTSSIRTLVSA